MALADYYLCDVCNCKCFYDSNLNWEWDTKDEPISESKRVRGTHMSLDNCGDIGAICRSCAATYEVVVREKSGEQPADERKDAASKAAVPYQVGDRFILITPELATELDQVRALAEKGEK